MTPLRQRMVDDMKLRGLSANTRDGFVNLARLERRGSSASTPDSSGTRCRVPNQKRTSPQQPVVGCPQQVTPDTEEILRNSVY